MKRTRRVVKKAPIIESNSDDSEDNVPLKNISKPLGKKDTPVKDKLQSNDSSSESDIENYLQPIAKIDLNSSFFKVQKKEEEEFNQIEKNIFANITRLSDSDSDEITNEDKLIFQGTKQQVKQDEFNKPSTSGTKLNFRQLEDYAKKIEEAKKHVEEYNARKKMDENNIDISNLLAAGESKQITLENIKPEDLHPSDFESCDSESEDWEEVKIKETQETKEKSLVPKNGVQITVDLPDTCRKKKGVDLLAAMKRRLNRIRKENQVYVHKVHVLCWIAHGNYINKAINNTDILGLALSLLPSDKCYPSDRTDLNYLEQIVQWYKKSIKLVEKVDTKDGNLVNLLQEQINRKEAWNKQMLVYIFITILRALGIQCRLVLSFQVEPLRPSPGELHSLAKDSSKNKVLKTNKLDKKVSKIQDKSSNMKEKKTNVKLHDTGVDLKNTSLTVKEDKNVPLKSLTGKEKLSQKIDRLKSKRIKSKTTNNNEETVTRSKTTRMAKKDKSKNVPQLDGINDSSDEGSTNNNKHKKKSRSRKVDLKKLNTPLKEKCEIKKHPNRLKSIVESNDSESEFKPKSPNTSKKNQSRESMQLRKIKLDKLQKRRLHKNNSQPSNSPPKKQLDVRNDIINLIKGRITEQKHIDHSRKVKKRKPLQDSDSDSDYMPEPIKKKCHDSDNDIDFFVPKPKIKQRISIQRNKPGQKILSSDNDLDKFGKKKKKGLNVWTEVFLESEEKWISVDVVHGQVHCVKELYNRATHPVAYIVAWNNNQNLKDVTKRYCINFNTITRKLRVDSKWWDETLKPFVGKCTPRDKEEDDDLNRQQLDQPLPATINEYKNHPLYALRRHLLKFEDIYPPDIQPLGFVRKEPVYPRNCVYVCRSRDIWLKEAKVVKPGEKPYKIVKARPKYDKLSNKIVTDQLLEIFGEWQTMDYEPPTAENGVVPRNAFGNVELFKPSMLPKGTVHLKLPGLNKICRRMDIDCASAIVGFDFHGGWSHPVYDGFVICEEFADTMIAAWELEQEEIAQKENEKIEKRVYGNWKKLIRGLLIRERLKARYDFGNASTSVEDRKEEKKRKGSKLNPKKRRIYSDSESETETT